MNRVLSVILLSVFSAFLLHAETLPPLQDDQPPRTYEALWSGFDPRAEPLDVEILHEWEEDEVVLRVIRYRIGVFKGKKAMMAAVYGFPKAARNGGPKLPGLLNIHGGGQYADYRAVLTNAKRGYATITIAWAGRISAPEYRVSPNEVKLFWEGKTEEPNYRVTTDWGALDAYHAPSRTGVEAFVSIPSGPGTLDGVASPRNNSWFLCTLGARRALTFLEQQPEVDGDRLGVYGHSMGGKLTIATAAADKRVKAAAPSCGGISDRYDGSPLKKLVEDPAALRRVTCPTIFLSPANDFHGHINNLVDAVEELGGNNEWRVTCSAHLNHRDYPENEVATQLWFDQYLKGTFAWPETPVTTLDLKTEDGIPAFEVRPDSSRPVLGVEVFYTQQGKVGKEHLINRINQFWHSAKATRSGDAWKAALPVFSTGEPLWVYANVIYGLDEAVSGAGYYYGDYTTDRFNLSSLVQLVDAEALQSAGVRATLQRSTMIESFEGDWRKEWYSYQNDGWGFRTHKVYHPIWEEPEGASLSFEVSASDPNTLVVGLNDSVAEVALRGGAEWQSVTLASSDFLDAVEKPRENWDELLELRFLPSGRLRSTAKDGKPRMVGGEWKGAEPVFRNLRWEK